MTQAAAALVALLAAAAVPDGGAAPAASSPPGEGPAEGREQRFQYLLRTYPERPPEQTLARVAELIEQGPFAERDRAMYWIGAARLSLGDREGARRQLARLQRDYPDTVWVERSWLGLAEAATAESRFGESLAWYGRADRARDPAVRELAALQRGQVLILRARQRAAWAAEAFGLSVAAWLLGSALRRERLARGGAGPAARALLVPPVEARVLLPVLGLFALLAAAQDPAPRWAVFEICLAGGGLVWLSGARLRAFSPASRAGRGAQAAIALAAFAAWTYTAVWRWNLVGMVLETLRAGPE
jgi:hypothetical protein